MTEGLLLTILVGLPWDISGFPHVILDPSFWNQFYWQPIDKGFSLITSSQWVFGQNIAHTSDFSVQGVKLRYFRIRQVDVVVALLSFPEFPSLQVSD